MSSSNYMSHKSKYFEEPFQTNGDAHDPHNIVKDTKSVSFPINLSSSGRGNLLETKAIHYHSLCVLCRRKNDSKLRCSCVR